MNINETQIKINGSANLNQAPTKTNCFVDMSFKNATLTGDIFYKDNEDGTHNQVFKIKITNVASANPTTLLKNISKQRYFLF